MIHYYTSSHLPVSRWRNGGGETREIISYPPGAPDFDWRFSIATLAASGDFSPFPGVDRIITLLSGESVGLYSNGRLRQRLLCHQPFAFSGEEAICARPDGQVSQDFNIMARRSRCHAEAGTTAQLFSPGSSMGGVVYILDGRWQHGQTLLAVGQGAWWTGHAGDFVPHSANALLLWGRLTPALSRDL